MKKPVRYHGWIHTLDKKDKRVKKYQKQLKTRGFDDTEMWNLDSVIASFILPRLKYFKEYHVKSALINKMDIAKIDNAIYAFEMIASDGNPHVDKKISNKIEKGLKDFAIIFRGLWT